MIRTFDTPITTNDQSIDRVLSAGLPVVLVFYHDRLPENYEPVLNQLASQHAGRLLVVKYPMRDNPGAVRKYGIGMTPALATIRDGQVLTKLESVSTGDLSQHVAYLLGKGPKPEVKNPAYKSQARPAAQASNTKAESHPTRVTDDTFDKEVLHFPGLVLVDFWAPWCGPCRMTDPIIEKLAVEMSGKLKVAKVNVDENPLTAERYDIHSIPAVMVVKNGSIVDHWIGAMPEVSFRNRIAPLLAS